MSSDVAAAATVEAPTAPPSAVVRRPRTREHPPYTQMVQKAIEELHGDRSGSSKVDIARYLLQNYKVGENVSKINSNISSALKRGLQKGELKQIGGEGKSGRFALAEKKAAAPRVKKPVVRRAKDEKPATVKEKSDAKKAKSKSHMSAKNPSRKHSTAQASSKHKDSSRKSKPKSVSFAQKKSSTAKSK